MVLAICSTRTRISAQHGRKILSIWTISARVTFLSILLPSISPLRTPNMAQQRAAQIAGHIYPQGMLAGQVAIITGSGQGIGAEAAQLFAKEGAKVVVQDIDGGIVRYHFTPHILYMC